MWWNFCYYIFVKRKKVFVLLYPVYRGYYDVLPSNHTVRMVRVASECIIEFVYTYFARMD